MMNTHYNFTLAAFIFAATILHLGFPTQNGPDFANTHVFCYLVKSCYTFAGCYEKLKFWSVLHSVCVCTQKNMVLPPY